MTEQRLFGQPASAGLFAGRLRHLRPAPTASRQAGTPEAEAAALREAIGTATARTAVLIGAADDDAAEILGFQLAMLEDPALAEPAFAAVAAGVPAEFAWREAMATETAGYRAAPDEYLRARAADLDDLRDRVLAALTGETLTAAGPDSHVLAAEDLTPSAFLAIDWRLGGAIALAGGSAASHVAMLARARGVPMVVGLGMLPGPEGATALVDGGAGVVVATPHAATRADFDARQEAARTARATADAAALRPAVTADGTLIRVLLNVGDPGELDDLDPAICDGVGLVRTEFLFAAGRELPDEAAQFDAYRRILRWAAGRPVVIRTLDAGGDKPIPGVTIDGESNPFLGQRGIRLSLARPEVFRVQLRALARAAVAGKLGVMLPMVAVPAELEAAAALLEAEIAALEQAGIPCARPLLGIMVEVPATAISAARFGAAFYSIGSNDLVQYTMAAARDIGAVAALHDPGNPAVLELIARTVAAGQARGVDVSLCGDAAGEPAHVAALLGTGLRALSMAPHAVGAVKATIAGLRLDAA